MSFWTDTKDWLSGTAENINWGEVLAFGASYALNNNSDFFNASAPPTGYQGGIPRYTMERAEVANTYDPNRRPGSSGQRYMSDRVFTPEGEASAIPALEEQAQGLAALNASNPARQMRAPAPQPQQSQQQTQASMAPILSRAPARVIEDAPVPRPVEGLAGFRPKYASGGIAGLYGPRSPMSTPEEKKNGYYLGGSTDGMADEVPAQIDGNQPAALSDGEFVIPADVVSHLGNGNSEAGAKQLYNMMDRARQERTGTTQQGKQINPASVMPK